MGHLWRFGECELDEAARVLRVRGEPVEIEAKPFEVLRSLLLHSGEVVTKTELLDSVWPGTAVVDGSLATAVSKVRKLLGDDEQVIVTVPRIGYKLSGPVHCKAARTPSEPKVELAPGQPVPRREQWHLTRPLDPANSDVWLAHHVKTRERRVFKFAPDDLRLKALKREVTVARLLREALGDRQEFVRVLEWNFDSPPYFLESEYAGPNLAEWANGQGGLQNVPWPLRLELLANIVRAVGAAHELDLLHKDLKPGNILIGSAPDGRPQVKIADFGSASLLVPARLAALGITNLGFTQTTGSDASALTGTLMYIAPEVYAGQTATVASDVYALGVLLYQLAAGDFRKPLAPGWEADIKDPLIREDIAEAACGDPTRRLPTAGALAERLATLDRRRAERETLARQRQQEAAAEVQRNRMRARRPWLALAGLILLAAITAAVAVFRRDAPGVRTVAVVPLQNVRADSGLDFLRRALADEIATALTHSHGVQVRPLAASEKFENGSVDLAAVARELQVETVVSGSYLKQGDRLHVTLEATNATNDQTIWRDSFDGPAESLIAAQVQIALRVRGGLASALGSTGMDASFEPRNEEAYELYLRSVALPGVPANNKQAVDMLERAVKLDPNYPPAWLALGRRYYVESRYAGADASMMARYDAALERAVSLDANYVPAGAGLIVSRVERGELVAAHRSAVDLVARRPDSPDAQFVLSYVFRYAGLLNEAAERCDTALVLDRKMQTNGLRSCAMVFLLRGDYPRAVNYLQFDQGSDFAKALTIDMLARQGRREEALRADAPDIPGWKSYGVLRACLAGQTASEIAALAQSVRASEDPELNYFAAAHLAYCGQTAEAVELLKRAVDGNYCSYPAMERDPLFARIRSTPGYTDVRAAGRACQERFLAKRAD
jgi:DNA-binding winged helix-turn-helix (wHTH) protein/serine/threonine protein kinase